MCWGRYAEVYAAVMEALEEAPRKLDAIESLTDALEITKSPRRFGQHFIDVLETCDCVIWGDGAWNLTDLGRAMLAELKSGAAASEDVNLVELMNARARSYGMLARLFREEVDLPTLRELQKMRFPQATGNAAADEGYHQLYDYLKRAWDDSVTELAIDYVSAFIGHGVNGYSAAYPYESVYTSERRLLMQEARAEVLATLRENELKRGNWNEAEDHIALELEFMQRMALRAAEALSDNAEDEAIAYLRTSYDFLENHLLNWVPMLVADMRMHARTLFYQGLGQLTLGSLQEDEAVLRELLDSVEA